MALEDAHRLVVAGEIAEVRAVAGLAAAWRVDEGAAGAAGERLVRGGAEGTPLVGEFLAAEIAPRLGVSVGSAAGLVARVLNVQFRHPRLWGLVLAGRVRFFQAAEVASRVERAGLDAAGAAWVDAQLGIALACLSWGRALALVDGLIVQADGALAARRAESAASARFVVVEREQHDGLVGVSGRVGVREGRLLDAQLDRLAEVLAENGDRDSLAGRRASAVGVLANPALALALLQASAVRHGVAVQPTLDTGCERLAAATPTGSCGGAALPGSGPAGEDRRTGGVRADPDGESAGGGQVGGGCSWCGGWLCGTVRVPIERLLPRSELIVHVTADQVAEVRGAARVEGVGAVPVERLKVLLGHDRVVVRPVVDLNDVPAVDRYEIPRRVHDAIVLTHPYEVFPYGARPSRVCDDDHTLPWTERAPVGAEQTRLGNLGPLGRRSHRVKTFGGVRLTQYTLGRFEYVTRYGARFRVGPGGARRFPGWYERELDPGPARPPAQPVGSEAVGSNAAALERVVLEGAVVEGVVLDRRPRVDLAWGDVDDALRRATA